MNRFFYDLEFIEDGRTIDLISIGIVSEDGRELYLVNRDAPWKRIRKHDWLMANVVPHLPRPHGDWILHMPRSWLIDFYDPAVKPKNDIRDEVREFLLADNPVRDWRQTELWAYYGAYDHVALCQLWGPMVQLPEGIPMWTNDIMQAAAGRELPEQTSGAHNALEDARHVRTMWEYLQ